VERLRVLGLTRVPERRRTAYIAAITALGLDASVERHAFGAA
jgi:hypothetical protein